MSDNPTPSFNGNNNGTLSPSRLWRRLQLWANIAKVTLRDPLLRFAGHLTVLGVIALGIWAVRLGWDTLPAAAAGDQVLEEEAPAESPFTGEALVSGPSIRSMTLPTYTQEGLGRGGVSRSAMLHTVFPERPRLDIITYIVEAGDSLFGIAENYNLKPETILWGNFDVLQDDPHRLAPEQKLNIPPVDGTLYEWHEGDGLNGVASFFDVEPGDILQWPGNRLDPTMDPQNPNIEAGTLLIVPGGRRELISWSAPRITRSNPAVAKILGPGACGSIVDGVVGTGTFIFPTASQHLSGFDYSSVHPGIDLAGNEGNAIFASDSGVVVYSGWNDWGYGYVVVLDHGTGWQTLYAHLSVINVACGQSVIQGDVFAGMGSTGNSSGAHLHLEMMHDTYGKVNPWLYLP
jgi:murein DD-endopeptidase MepM/ murein hydrolase activator NlpD